MIGVDTVPLTHQVIKDILVNKESVYLSQEEAARILGIGRPSLRKAQNDSGIIGLKVPGTNSYKHTADTLIQLIEHFNKITY